MKILILGGTAEARHLADRLVALGHDVITSLAGRTQQPMLPSGAIRVGSLGGAAGLGAYLRAAQIERLVDATHPYAAQMSRNADDASREARVPLVRLMRPAWVPRPGQNWMIVSTAREARDALPPGANVLLTTGHTDLAAFLERRDCRFLVRVIEAPDFALPDHARLLQARPPYGYADELALMRNHGVTHLVSKNSGGAQVEAKLDAAANLGVSVIMIARPSYGPASDASSVEEALLALDLGEA